MVSLNRLGLGLGLVLKQVLVDQQESTRIRWKQEQIDL